jgi:hypothetical protein
MAKLTNLFNKETALDILYLGGGAAVGGYAGSKIYDKIKESKPDFDTDKKLAPYVKGGIPIAVGLLLPSLAGGSNLVKKIGQGMFAAGSGIIVNELLRQAGVELKGVGNVMMGNVMMQGMTPDRSLEGGVALGNVGYDNYTATSYDITPAAAGEMDY